MKPEQYSSRSILVLGTALLLVLLSFCKTSNAHSTSSIQGKVIDQNDAAIPAATIAAYHLASGLTRTGETDALGNYQIAALPVGLYRLDVHRSRLVR